MNTTTKKITINGIVQGVGFRPFIYTLALKHNLTGYVLNNPQGVLIIAQGTQSNVEAFIKNITLKAPALAHINKVKECVIDSETFTKFFIKESEHTNKPTTLISPDACTCDDCLNELFNKNDPRYLYPFINCTNCGPRFTIIQNLPYDRPYTTMSSFIMCALCEGEYKDPLNRRFHAQPNACPQCGPKVSLLDNKGQTIEGDAIVKAIELIKQGKIIAIKALGGYQLACDPTNDEAVKTLRKRKNRDEKPFALMCPSIIEATKISTLTQTEKDLLTNTTRPIIIANRLPSTASCPEQCRRNRLSNHLAPNNPYLGIMLPNTPLHYLLFYNPLAGGDFNKNKSIFPALVMTSGNISEEPIIKDDDEAFERLADVVDAFLTHNRPIHVRCDDSIVRVVNDKPQHIRRARGLTPAPIFLEQELPNILAVGAELKNSLCITNGNRAFVSQYIGDLENVPTLDYFKEAVDHFERILDIKPDIIAHDMHPEYLSTKFIQSTIHDPQSTVFPIQHHHAHIASVMAEHNITDKIIGFAFDGTGYGTDGTIWGGEVLVCTPSDFERVAHLRPLTMPGGTKAIKEPWRMAYSYLLDAFDGDVTNLNLDCLKQMNPTELNIIKQAALKKINSPITSSMGRLFDAIASLLNIKHHVSFEGQAAMMLEWSATNVNTKIELPYNIIKSEVNISGGLPRSARNDEVYQIDFRPLVRKIAKHMTNGTNVPELAMAFHVAIVNAFCETAINLKKQIQIQQVALSGGSWQNKILMQKMTEKLENQGFTVYTNELIPVNDGGISLGQAFIAAHE